MSQIAEVVQNKEREKEVSNSTNSVEKDFFIKMYVLITDFMKNCHPVLRAIISIAVIVMMINGMYTAGHNFGELLRNIMG
ncbi:MAG: hypothetical protein Q4D51_13545 [Eubacteriales bacterium]|nr:hypothetical protein [Eubacteriales bacterium]